MMVQRRRDEVEMTADDRRTLGVAGLDFADQAGSVAQLVTEDPVDDCHLECVGGHRHFILL